MKKALLSQALPEKNVAGVAVAYSLLLLFSIVLHGIHTNPLCCYNVGNAGCINHIAIQLLASLPDLPNLQPGLHLRD